MLMLMHKIQRSNKRNLSSFQKLQTVEPIAMDIRVAPVVLIVCDAVQ
jgi:hypothetical protein